MRFLSVYRSLRKGFEGRQIIFTLKRPALIHSLDERSSLGEQCVVAQLSGRSMSVIRPSFTTTLETDLTRIEYDRKGSAKAVRFSSV